jgi:hypothetical protein
MKSEIKKSKTLKTTETDARLNPRVTAFLRRSHAFASLCLQPLTAGRLVALQISQSRFLFLTGRRDHALAEVERWEDLDAQISTFLFVLSAPPDDVATAILEKRKQFNRIALRFCKTLTAKQRKRAVSKIVKILFELASEDGEVIVAPHPQPSEKKHNLPDSTWIISYVCDIAARTGWSPDFIVWELPLAVGSQLRHALRTQSNIVFPLPQSLNPEAESLAQLQSQLQAIKNG